MPGAMGGMSTGMRPGPYTGYDPEMNAWLAQQLQELRTRETQLNTEITMAGGETSPAARPLLMAKTMLQGQIRELEKQINPAAAATGMPGYGMTAPTAADMMGQGLPGQAGLAGRGMPGAGLPPGMAGYGVGANAGMGAGPNAMMLEQLRQDVLTELRYAQQTLSQVDANDPFRATIESRQAELLNQLESLNQQLGQSAGAAPGAGAPGLSSASVGLTGAGQPTGGIPGANAASATNDPRVLQMMNAERQLRAMGNTALADDILRQIEQLRAEALPQPTANPFAAGALPPGSPMGGFTGMGAPAPTAGLMPPAGMPPTMPGATAATPSQQAELAELRGTVDALRGEIASMREEIRSLETLLRQSNPLPRPNGAGEPPANATE